jgi:hypothetical protein
MQKGEQSCSLNPGILPMKTLRCLFIVIAAAYATALYGEEKAITVDFTPRILSKYVDADGAVFYDGAVAQADLTVSVSNGLYLNVWQSRGLRGHRDGQVLNETDYHIGWAGEVGGLTIDVSGGYYDLAPIMKDARNAIRSFAVELRPSGERPFTPFVSVESYHMRSDADFEGGTRTRLGVEFSLTVSKVSIEQVLEVCYEDGAFGYGKAAVGIYNADVTWSVGKMKLILTSLALYHPFVKHNGQKNELVVGLGARWSF